MRRRLLRSRARTFVIASCFVTLASASFAFSSEAFASGKCPNEAFRVGPSAALPDCRAYEMVTPVFKNTGDVTTETALAFQAPRVSSDGQSLTVWSTASFAGATGNSNAKGSPYRLSRTGSGWVTTPMELPESQFLTFEMMNIRLPEFGGTLDGRSEAKLAQGVSRPGNSIDVYRIGADGSVVDVGPVLPPSAPYERPVRLAGPEGAGLTTTGMSADGSRLFFSTISLHWPFDETPSGWESLYEYAGTGNTEPMLVGVDNDGKVISDCGTFLGGVQNGPEFGSSGEGQLEETHNAISADGATVFFTAAKPQYTCGGAKSPPADEVFARIDNGLPGAHTVAISEPTREDCEECNTSAPANAIFEGASADGSKVFFSTHQALLGSDNTQNLYEYDFNAPAGHRVIRVSGGDPAVSNPVAGVIEEPAAISEDGSHIYFGATGVLTTTPNDQGLLAQAGATNLYVFERDARHPSGHTAFIAAPVDGSMFLRKRASGPSRHGAAVTPDGRFLVFLSEGDLTPDDTSSVEQVFEYDSSTERLVRVSIGQGGFKDNGNTSVYPAEIPSPREDFKVSEHADPRSYWSHMAASADGAYVFFESHDALAPGALEEQAHELIFKGEYKGLRYTNGPNVYEYHDGNVYLITRASSNPRPLIGTDASGQDVFINTTEPLVGQDTDTNGDIYDARIGGGFPAPAAAPGCAGDACQGALGGAPVLLSPGSEFQAGGNPPLASPPSAVRPVAKKKAKAKKKRKKKAKRAAKSGHRGVKGGRR
jgi:hypothetical protein